MMARGRRLRASKQPAGHTASGPGRAARPGSPGPAGRDQSATTGSHGATVTVSLAARAASRSVTVTVTGTVTR